MPGTTLEFDGNTAGVDNPFPVAVVSGGGSGGSDSASELTQQDVVRAVSKISFMRTLGKFTFDNAGQLRSVVSGSLSTVSTVTTVTTVSTVSAMTQGNVSYGDAGKPATVQVVTQSNFQTGVGRNFQRT